MPITFISNSAGGYIVPFDTMILMESASVPPGFEAYNALNNYYIVSDNSVGVGTSRGSPTHSHTQSLSAITGAGSHVHTADIDMSQSGQSGYDSYGYAGTVGSPNHKHASSYTFSANANHTHAIASSSSGTATNTPPYKSLYAFKATVDADLPSGAIVIWSGGTPPVGFYVCDGSSASPDMRNYYLKLGSGSGGSWDAHTHVVGALASTTEGEHSVSMSFGGNSTGAYAQWDQHSGAGDSHNMGGHAFTTTGGSGSAHTHAGASSGAGTSDYPRLWVYFIKYVAT